MLWDVIVENGSYKQLINDLALIGYTLQKLEVSVGKVTNLYDNASILVQDDSNHKIYKVEI